MSLMARRRRLLPLDSGIEFEVEVVTASWTSGFTFTFTGSLSVDWGDGSPKEDFISGIEKTHLYSTGTYIAKITGDFKTITTIRADNSRIKSINNLKTSLLTSLNLSSNQISTLDLSEAPLTGQLNLSTNASLSSILFAASGNGKLTDVDIIGTGLTSIDFSNMPIGGDIKIYSNSLLTSVTFASSGNTICSVVQMMANPVLTGLDFSNVPLTEQLWVRDNIIMSSLVFAASGNGKLTDFLFYNCNIGTLDLSNMPISGTFLGYGNGMTSITFATSGNTTVSNLSLNGNSFTTIDFTNVWLNNVNTISGMPSLTSIIIGTVNGNIGTFNHSNNNLGVVNYGNIGWNINNASLLAFSNGMTAAEVNEILVGIDTVATSGFTGRSINIAGSNAAPDSSSGGFNGTAAVASLISKGFSMTTS